MIVGWGSADITPRNGCIIAGAMPFRPAHAVHDEVYATAMVIGTGDQRTIWVSCDMCHPTAHLYNDAAALLKTEIPGFSEERFILNSTHATACFYLTDREFLMSGQRMPLDKVEPIDDTRANVCRGIALAVRQAVEDEQECTASVAESDILTGFCRRVVYQDGSAAMYGDVHREDFVRMEYPDGGPSQYIYFRRRSDGKLAGILANVPCPSQADESSVHITADYWGVVRKKMREHYGEKVCVLATCRAAGELSPHRLLLSPDRRSAEWGTAAAERLGRRIAESIINAENEDILFTLPEDADVKTLSRWVEFPVRQPTDEERKESEAYFADAGNFDENGIEKDVFKHVRCAHIRFLEERKPGTYRAKITAMRLGNTVLFTAPAELYTEYAVRIVTRFKGCKVFDVQLAQDCLGYLPTREAILHGGYSAQISDTVTDAEGGELYVREATGLIRSLIGAE